MREAVFEMLARYDCQRTEDTTRALREILQELALLGLWRAKFFEKAAFYGGTALRILYGLDRFSEDLDFSLLQPMPGFQLERYSSALERELAAFGFEVRVEQKGKAVETAVQSAFLKANTANELLVIQAGDHIRRQIPAGQLTRIKIEVDTDPPPGFSTEEPVPAVADPLQRPLWACLQTKAQWRDSLLSSRQSHDKSLEMILGYAPFPDGNFRKNHPQNQISPDSQICKKNIRLFVFHGTLFELGAREGGCVWRLGKRGRGKILSNLKVCRDCIGPGRSYSTGPFFF